MRRATDRPHHQRSRPGSGAHASRVLVSRALVSWALVSRALVSWALVSSALGAVALGLGACGSGPLSLRPAEHTFTASDYGSVLDRWTRSADDFDFGNLNEVLHVTATFESHEMRWAYVVRYAADHSMTTEERARLLERSLADAGDRHRFFVTIGAPIFREGDLTGDQSDWRVLLVDDNGHQTEPVELLRIPRPSRDMRAYFRAIHRQRHVFRIAFPVIGEDGAPSIEPTSRRVTLRFAGASGTVNLEWELDGHGVDPLPVP